MKQSKITIIVPVYNLEEYIATCLDSLLSQTYPHLEIIVVDDGSTDNSWQIISGYAEKDNRILALQQQNGGAAKARNTALECMTGDFFTFVDGDDRLSEDVIKQNIPFLEKNSLLDWVAFPIYRINLQGEPIYTTKNYLGFIPNQERILQKQDLIPTFIENGLSGVACGAIYRKTTMGNIRFPAGEYYEDSFYFTDVLVHTQKAMISILGRYGYTVREGSSQLTQADQKRLQSRVKMLEHRISQWEAINPKASSEYKKWESGLYYYLKTAVSKKVPGADEVLDSFTKQMKYSLKRDWLSEFRMAIYRIVGYKNLRFLFK